MEFLDYNLSLSLPNELPVNQRWLANTLNPHSYCVAKKDAIFRASLEGADILIPDGVGVVWASKFLYGKRIKKISGYDLHLHFLNLLHKQGGGKVFYLGASESTLSKIKEKLAREFPKINVETLSPPYKQEFSKEENLSMIQAINAFAPDLLFVGMTAPKQEKWLLEHKYCLEAKVMCAIGAVFDFYAGTVKRPSRFWVDLGLEWFPRFIKEPKRLWRRNLVSTPQFIFDILKLKLKA